MGLAEARERPKMSSPYTNVFSPKTNVSSPKTKCVFAKHIMVLFLMIFGRIELILSVSKAKFDAEADFEVHRPPNPQNPDKKRKKLFFRTENFRQFFFSVSKNETLGIVRNGFSQSLAAVRPQFEGLPS